MSLFVLILGANGTLGTAVSHKFIQEGFNVHAQARDNANIEEIIVPYENTENSTLSNTTTNHKRLRVIRGDPSGDQFWSDYDHLLHDLGINCSSLDEVEARYTKGNQPLSTQEQGNGILVAIISCTGNLECRSVCETTQQHILEAISAHVLPMQQSLRHIPVISGNRYCCYVAVGSDPLSWEGTIDCCPYCVAKFALRGLMDCARHDMPHSHIEEIYVGNFLSGLWVKSGIDCPFVETTAETVADNIFKIIHAQIMRTRSKIMSF